MSERQPSSDQSTPLPTCPRCEGPMWDNREGKRNPKAPDFKCKDRECDGVIWPPRQTSGAATSATPGAATSAPAATASAAARPSAKPSATPNASAPASQAPTDGMPACPICGGAMWDDRASKRNPRAPDFKCKNKPRERGGPGCEGVIWPPRDGSPSPYPASARRAPAPGSRSAPAYDAPPLDDAPPHDDDDLPF